MKTYLFAWNPDKWDWATLEENIIQLDTIGYYEDRWSCGNSKKIQKGDRAFLMKLGVEPKGIIGSGYAKSNYYKSKHWDESVEDKLTNYIDIEFDVLLNPNKGEILPIKALEVLNPESKQIWFPRQSGIQIKEEIVQSLETLWFNYLNDSKLIKNNFISNELSYDSEDGYPEGKVMEIKMTRYERNRGARQKCINHYGYSCKVCQFNFQTHFGEIGQKYIHVHHLNPVAEIGKEYKLDPIGDLRPVCPNCHSMIHIKKPPFTIEELQEIRKKQIK